MDEDGFAQLQVLIVDDNKHMRDLLGAVLNAFGCSRIDLAGGGEEAWKAICKSMPDIVFADLIMRPVDGIAFTQRVRQDPGSPNPYLPVIMISGHASLERVHEARNAGVNEFLAKPASPNGVLNRIRSVVEHPRPFVRSEHYFGPDRRRITQPDFGGGERRGFEMGFQIDDELATAMGN